MCNIYYIALYKTTTRLHELALYNMEDRRGKIIEYVKANSRCTKTEVIKDMEKKGIGSIKTIHPIIIDLLNEGILLVLKNRPNSQIHRLIINDKNEFNQIDETLSEIENFMDKMDEQIDKMRIARHNADQINGDAHRMERAGSAEVVLCFLIPYRESLRIIIDDMLVRIGNANFSEKDTKILYTKIIELLKKLTGSFLIQVPDSSTVLNNIISSAMKDLREAKYIQNFVKKHGINLNIVNDLEAVVERYKNQFLIDHSSEQKTEKPHENL